MLKNNSMFRLTAVIVLVAMLFSTACVTGISFAESADIAEVQSGSIVIDPESISGDPVDNPGEGVDKLFDGDINTKLCTTLNGTFVISFALTDPAKVNSYSISTAGDAEERDPKDWKFYGSVDGTDWVLLDERYDVDLPERLMIYTFNFENEVEYTYFKLDIEGNNGLDAWGGNRIQFADFKISYSSTGVDTSSLVKVGINTASVKSSANLDGGQGMLQIFDDNVDTKACIVNVSSLWVSAQLNTYSAVCMYRIASANDHDPRDPRDWTLYGSNDGEEWVALDTRVNEDLPERNTYYTYTFENTTEYCYYKLHITSNNGADAVGLQVLQFAELQLFAPESDREVIPEAPETSEPTEEPEETIVIDTTSITGSEVNNPGEGLENLFDGNIDSKLCTTYEDSLFVSFKLMNAAVVNTYRISSAIDAEQRDPKDWKFYGSVDGNEWVLLDSRTDADLINRRAVYTYYFNNNVEYTYFMFEVLANNGTDAFGLDLIQFAELQLDYTDPSDFVIDPVKVNVDLSTVQGSAGLDGDQGIMKIFDGSVSTKVCVANVSTLWVSAKLSNPAAVCMYRIASANDHDPRDPRDWTLYGSNDGEEWVALDTRENEDMPARNTYYTYTFENTTEYAYYKLDITSNNGADAVGLQVVQFSEWQLYALPSDDQPDVPVTPDPEPEPEFGFKVEEDGTRYYYEDGTFAKGWQTIDGKTYRFDGQGLLFEGESLVYGSQTFWFDADHAVREGLVLDADGYRFYIGGVRQYAWQDTDGDGEKDSYFYVSSYLRCEVDRMLFDGVASRRFYVYDAETGFMVKAQGFYTNEKGTQYFINGIGKYGWITPEGEIITDRPGVTVYGAYYFAYGDGINYYRVEDASKTIGGVTRVFDEDHLVTAYTGWVLSRTTGNPNYYVEGELQQGWCLTPEGWVYLSRSEKLEENISYGDVFYEWRKIGGKVYYFRASTSNPAYTLITDAERALNYQGSRDVYIINQPADPTTATGADYYITNPPAGF